MGIIQFIDEALHSSAGMKEFTEPPLPLSSSEGVKEFINDNVYYNRHPSSQTGDKAYCSEYHRIHNCQTFFFSVDMTLSTRKEYNCLLQRR